MLMCCQGREYFEFSVFIFKYFEIGLATLCCVGSDLSDEQCALHTTEHATCLC
jgi:hypothetical protein